MIALMLLATGALNASVAQDCFALNRDVAEHHPIRSELGEVVPCVDDAVENAAYFHRSSGEVRAAVDLQAGVVVGPIWLPAGLQAPAGQSASLVVERGGIRIERQVTLAQPVTEHSTQVFVRAQSGEILLAKVSQLVIEGAE